MILQGSNGVGINDAFQSKDAILSIVENGSTSAITKGSLCSWDTTANVAQAGIMQDTLGFRVLVTPTATTLPNQLNFAGFATSAMAATVAGTRGQNYIIQQYGYFASFRTAAADADTAVGAILIPSTSVPGAVMGCVDNAAPTVTSLGESFLSVGIAGEAVTTTTTTFGIIKWLL